MASKRHHYVPEFYLKHWRSDKGGIFNYKKIKTGISKPYKKYEKACGFEDKLYWLKPHTKHNPLNYPPDYLETYFFRKIDNDAAPIHKKLLLSGFKNVSLEDKYFYALFLRSLEERTPDKINRLFSHFKKESIQNSITQTLNAKKVQTDFDLNAMQENEILLQLTREIRNESNLTEIVGMHWSIADSSKTGEQFITSDRPLIINGGLEQEHPKCTYSIALSPKKLLVIYSNEYEDEKELVPSMALMHNVVVALNAKNYIYSNIELSNTRHIKYNKFLDKIGQKLSSIY